MYSRIIYAIENGLRYMHKDIDVRPVFNSVSDKTPHYSIVKVKSHPLAVVVKRYNHIYLYLDLVQGANIRLVNVILKHFTHGEYKVRKRGTKYVMYCRNEAAIWTVTTYE